MKKLFLRPERLYLLGFLLIISLILIAVPVFADDINITLAAPENNSIITSGFVDFKFNVNMTCNCSLYINNQLNLSLNLSSKGNFAFSSIELPNGNYFWNISGLNHTDNSISGGSEVRNFTIARVTGVLTVTECPTESTATVLVLWLVIVISLFFLMIGFVMDLGLIGFFGAIMFMITTWYLSPCQPFFAFVAALFSFVLIIWFVVAKLIFTNTTFRDN